MATYTELRDLYGDDALKNRLDIAVTVAAQELMEGATPTTGEQQWAASVLRDPRPVTEQALRFLLAKDRTASVSAIQGATDAAIQARVDDIKDSLVAAWVVLV